MSSEIYTQPFTGSTSSTVEITISPPSAAVRYVHVETLAERYMRLSNIHADTLGEMMEIGYDEEVVEHYAEVVDALALLSRIASSVSSGTE